MTTLKIIRMGNPVLRARAEPVADPTLGAIRRLADGMIQTMLNAPGVGLAAPQVNESIRMITLRVPEGGDADAVPVTVLINPVLEPLSDERALGLEGCLSIPGWRGLVPRFTRLRYRAVGLDGEPLEGIAEGFHARVLQHEVDHLDGILYLDRMDDLRLLGVEDETHNVLALAGMGE